MLLPFQKINAMRDVFSDREESRCRTHIQPFKMDHFGFVSHITFDTILCSCSLWAIFTAWLIINSKWLCWPHCCSAACSDVKWNIKFVFSDQANFLLPIFFTTLFSVITIRCIMIVMCTLMMTRNNIYIAVMMLQQKCTNGNEK